MRALKRLNKLITRSLLASALVVAQILPLLAISPKLAGAAETTTLYPNGQGVYTAWTGDESNVDETGDPSSCSGDDVISTGTNNARESVLIDLASITNGSTITSVTVYVTYSKSPQGQSGGTFQTFARLNSADTNSGSNITTDDGNGCDSLSQNIDTTDTVKSGSTTLEIGVLKTGSSSPANRTVRVSTIRAVVTYTAAPLVSPLPNEPLLQACGLDIALVMDNSASISNSQHVQFEQAAQGFVDSLLGTSGAPLTNTRFSVVVFGSSATASTLSGDRTAVSTAVAAYPNTTDNSQYTNWTAGLTSAQTALAAGGGTSPRLIIFMTDGDPTASPDNANGPTDSTSINNNNGAPHLAPAITAANAAKTAGTRVLALGVANPGPSLSTGSLNRLKDISGGASSVVNGANIATTDVITGTFDTLGQKLGDFAMAACGGTINIHKLIDIDGNPNTADYLPSTSPEDDGWDFQVTRSGMTPINDVTGTDGWVQSIKVNPAAGYAVTEDLSSNSQYNLLKASCTNGNSTWDAVGATVSGINVSNNTIVNCTFINTHKKGSIELKKTWVGVPGQTTLKIGTSAGGSQVDSQLTGANGTAPLTTGSNIVNTGDYYISETALADYDATTSCVDEANNNTLVSVGQNGKVAVGENQQVVCTITNTSNTGSLKVVKNVINDNGGTKKATDFTFTDNGGSPQNFTLTNDEDGEKLIDDLPVGSIHTIVELEANTGGYSTSYGNCTDVVIVAGQTQLCTITNDDVAPTLMLIKNVVNDNGGTQIASAWVLIAQAGSDTPVISEQGTIVPDTNDQQAQTNAAAVSAGIFYTLSENGPTGYSSSDWTCDGGEFSNGAIKLALGATVKCSITNNDEPGKLIVEKVVINDNGGEAKARDFKFRYNQSNPVRFESDGSNEITVSAGVYNIVEEPAKGYSVTYEGCTDITVAAGETKKCIITNNDIPAKLTLNKKVINNNGGTLKPSDFPLTISNMPGTYTSGQTVELNAGWYEVGEVQQDGYITLGWDVFKGDCGLTGKLKAELGKEYECTITNDDLPGKIVVHKKVINDDSGKKKAKDFQYKVNDGNWTNFSLLGLNFEIVNAGTYSVVEKEDSGYDTTYAGCSEIVVRNGEIKHCYITNDDKENPVVIVEKEVECNGRATEKISIRQQETENSCRDGSFHFVLNSNGQQYAGFTLSDGGIYSTEGGLKPGPVEISEDETEGWSLDYSNCYYFAYDGDYQYRHYVGTEFTAEPGRTYYCEFYNVFKELDLELDKSDDEFVTEAGEQYDYTIDVKNINEQEEGGFSATGVRVVDTLDENLKFISYTGTDWTCVLTGEDENGFGGTVTCDYAGEIAPGESAPQITITVETSEDIEVDEITNTATVTSKEFDVNPENNTDEETTPVKLIQGTVEAVCINNFPYLRWNVRAVNFTPLQFVIEWFTVSGNEAGDPAGVLVSTQTFPVSEVNFDGTNYSATTLWPGANDDPNNPDWPGWELVNGEWVADPSSFGGNLRPASNVVLSSNPSTQGEQVYPPATPQCDANPPTGRVLGASTLASTGRNLIFDVFAGMMLVSFAIFLSAATAKKVKSD